jgi:hypothetical protein
MGGVARLATRFTSTGVDYVEQVLGHARLL